jgi:hypothetical protein
MIRSFSTSANISISDGENSNSNFTQFDMFVGENIKRRKGEIPLASQTHYPTKERITKRNSPCLMSFKICAMITGVFYQITLKVHQIVYDFLRQNSIIWHSVSGFLK